MMLSKRRAQTVREELIFSNVRPDRIVTQWVGESRPVAPNVNPDGSDNREGRQLNRRVEVVGVESIVRRAHRQNHLYQLGTVNLLFSHNYV